MAAPTANFDASQSSSPTSVAPAHTAVLLMDYHNMIVSMCGDDAGPTVTTAAALRDWALARGMVVYHCLIDLKGSPPASSKMAPRFGPLVGALKEKPELAAEPAELAPKGGDDAQQEKVVARKPGTVSALSSVGLVEQLKAKNIQSLIIAGLSSSGVTLSTTRDATDRGYIVTVVQDGCADRVPGLHQMLMEHALPMTAHVAPFKDIQAAWK